MDAIVDTDILRVPAAGEAVVDSEIQSFCLADGRRIAFCVFGACDGFPVLALHGTPGSSMKFRGASGLTARVGLRLICPDRWGYGDTSLHPAPSLSAFARDALALLDGFGAERFALIGVSGGGPYATAVAAAAGDRVSRLALVSPVGLISGLPGKEMRAFHRLCFRLLPRLPGATTVLFRFYRRLLLLAPRTAIGMASSWSIDVDREIVRTPTIREGLAASFRAGLLRHAAGAVCDVKLFARAWDVDARQVRAPARIWLGTLDRNVPQAAVSRLAEALPHVELTRVEGEGHFLIARRLDDVLLWLSNTQVEHTSAGDRPSGLRAQSSPV
jgi:pimeloyl-ACP methyl ester carboxylesterase